MDAANMSGTFMVSTSRRMSTVSTSSTSSSMSGSVGGMGGSSGSCSYGGQAGSYMMSGMKDIFKSKDANDTMNGGLSQVHKYMSPFWGEGHSLPLSKAWPAPNLIFTGRRTTLKLKPWPTGWKAVGRYIDDGPASLPDTLLTPDAWKTNCGSAPFRETDQVSLVAADPCDTWLYMVQPKTQEQDAATTNSTETPKNKYSSKTAKTLYMDWIRTKMSLKDHFHNLVRSQLIWPTRLFQNRLFTRRTFKHIVHPYKKFISCMLCI